MDQIEQHVIQELSTQIANLSVDRAVWRARALVSETQLEELAEEADSGDDTDDEVDDE